MAAPPDDTEMELAVEKLAAVLQQQGEGGAIESDSTQEIITKISEQIARMMESPQASEAGRGAFDDGPYTPTQRHANADGSNGGGTGGGAHGIATELPQYPTPYELWRKAHEVPDDNKKPPVALTENEWGELVERLHDAGRKKHVSTMRRQNEIIKEQLASLNFQPYINPESREMAQVAPLHERMTHILKLRHEKLEKARAKLLEKEVAEVTASPHINKSTLWKPRVNRRYTTPDKYDDREDRELTFHPQINANSDRLYRRMKARTRRETGKEYHPASPPRRLKVTGTNKDAGHEQETFSPQINHRSRALRRDKGSANCFERLYAQARESQRAKRQLQQKFYAQNLKHHHGSIGGDPTKRTQRTPRRGGRPAAAAALPPPTPPPVAASPATARTVATPASVGAGGDEVVVAYDPKYDFIVQRVLQGGAS